jgi:hypothetical protein
MQKFWYEYVRPKYPDAKMLYTDTDSFVYKITNSKGIDMPDFHGKTTDSMFDTSGLYKSHPHASNCNKKVLGKFKDECNGVPISEFVALRAKMYAMKVDAAAHARIGDKEVKLELKKSKGTKKSVVKKEIKFNDYMNVLQTGKSISRSQVGFRTDKQQIYTVKCKKIALSAFDNKRYLMDDGITSLPYGHYAIPK